MSIRSTLVAVAITGTVVVIGAAGTAQAQSDDTPPAGEAAAKGAFVCANLEQIQQLLTDRGALLEDRLALLQEARAAAEQNGNTKAIERIDRRTERVTERQAKVAGRQDKLTAFAAENCAG